MGVSEELEKSGFTTKSLVTGTIVMLFFAWSIGFRSVAGNNGLYAGGDGGLNNQAGTSFTQGLGASMLTILVLALINCAKPVFSKQEIALIALLPPLSAWWQGMHSNLARGLTILASGIGWASASDYAKYIDYVPALWGPKDPSFWNSGWWQKANEYPNFMLLLAGQLGWTILWYLATSLSALFIVLLVRHIYVNVEYLTSPLVEIYTVMVESTQPEKESGLVKLFKNKILLVSFIIGFVHIWVHWGIGFMPPLWTGQIASRFPNRGYIPIGGVNFDLLWGRTPNLQLMGLIPWVPLYISYVPMEVAWQTLQSMDVLYGFLVGWFIIYVIWPLAEVGAGRYPAYTAGTATGTVNTRIWWGDPSGYLSIFIPFGVTIGLGLYPLVRNRRIFSQIAMSLFKKPSENIEKESPLTYRFIWVGLIAAVVITIAAAAIVSVPAAAMTVYTIVILFSLLGLARGMAETGGYMGCWKFIPYSTHWMGFFGAMIISAFGLVGTLNQTNVVSYWLLARDLTNYSNLWSVFIITAVIALAVFQVGERTKTTKKSSTKMLLIMVPATMIAASFFMYWWIGFLPFPTQVGTAPASTWISTMSGLEGVAARYTWMGPITAAHIAATGANMGLLALGIVIAFAIPMLRIRAPWLRLSVAGILFGMMVGYEWWFTSILAILIKFIAIKVGGIRLYDEKVKPICIGLAAGSFLAIVIYWFLGGTYMTTWSLFTGGSSDLY